MNHVPRMNCTGYYQYQEGEEERVLGLFIKRGKSKDEGIHVNRLMNCHPKTMNFDVLKDGYGIEQYGRFYVEKEISTLYVSYVPLLTKQKHRGLLWSCNLTRNKSVSNQPCLCSYVLFIFISTVFLSRSSYFVTV